MSTIVRENTPYVLFMILVLAITIAFFGIIRDFFYACFWSIVIAIIFHPLYCMIREKMPSSQTSPIVLCMLFIFLVLILPVTLLLFALIDESAAFYLRIESGEINPRIAINQAKTLMPSISQLPFIDSVDIGQLEIKASDTLTDILKSIAGQIPKITQNVLGSIVNFFLFLYLLFFMLRDGPSLLRRIIRVLPLGDEKELALCARFTSVARATVKGGLLVALLQGSVGGLAFLLVGIPSAFIWGSLMVLLSLLPIGSGLIWGPAALILLLQEQYWQGIALIFIGTLGIGLVDNFLRPFLIGNDIKMPDYLVLLSTLGGLTSFSLTGFVLGPMIAALFITCWEILGRDSEVKQ